jgi:glycosyltransferase 2 family protein
VNRASLVRGIQLVVVITLATFALLLYRAIAEQRQDLLAGLHHVRPAWLLFAACLALQEGVCGGLRMFVLSRVLCPTLTPRTAIASEFVLMFVGGITPGQLGAPVSQVAVLVEGGMPFAAIATAELLTAFCTISFFLLCATSMLALRTTGHLEVPGAERFEYLLGFSAAVFGACFVALLLCAAYPPLLKRVFALGGRALGPLGRALVVTVSRIERFRTLRDAPWAQPGGLTTRLVASVDRVHEGFMVYVRRGKRAVAAAFALTVCFFFARFAVSYFILLGLGLPTTPHGYVTVGPPIVQVMIVQGLLNFALYLSPTPGASGIAETGSNTLMSPWVTGAYELPYLVLWRLLALFLCMFVGGSYVFRYLGTDVLERRVQEARAAEASLTEAPPTPEP